VPSETHDGRFDLFCYGNKKVKGKIMGLLDSLLGAALGGGNQQQNTAVQLVLQLIEKSGGVGNLMNTLQQNGLAGALQSWISTGGNEAVSGQQVESALGGDLLNQVAAKVGINGSDASDLLAQYLPKIIDQMTPNGDAGDAQGVDLASIGGALLKNMFK
jgi:uncharacterized protein YidB (DUF937 family)